MIGKRVVMLKRPAVLCAAVFVIGIMLARFPGAVALCTAGGLLFCGMLFFRRLQKGKQRISAVDKVLCLVPVFLMFGYLVMSRAQVTYEQNRQSFSLCLREGRELLAEGTIAHIGRTATGVRLELKDAEVVSYNSSETGYRPVGRLLVYAEDMEAENGELKYGQRIFVYGNGSEFEQAPNPGGFDANAYYFSLGITGAIQSKTLRIRDFSYQRLNQALFQAKSKLLDSYVTYLGEDDAGVISSMLLGERSLLSDETQELYRRGGISHVLAISGLHVSMIGVALYECLRKTVLGRNGAIPVACAGVLLYGTFVGAGTSTKRAVIMFLLLLLATALGRTYDTLSAMSASAVVILCQSPGTLYTASFQLSFAAAYGASVLAVLLKEQTKKQGTCLENGGSGGETEHGKESTGIETDGGCSGTGACAGIEIARRVAKRENCRWVRIRESVVDKLKNMFVFGLAIQVVTFPFTVYHFFEYPTYGFLLNPVVVPLMTVLLLCGLLAGVCGLFVPWLGHFFAGGTGGILWVYDMLCRLTQKLPGSLLLFGQPKVWQVGVYYVLLVFILYLWMRRGGKRMQRVCAGTEGMWEVIRRKVWNSAERWWKMWERQGVVLLCLFFLPLCLLPVFHAKFEVVFLDVGQGDGIVLRERGGAVLMVDGGSTSVQKVGEKRVIPYLKSQGIRKVDSVFISHTDSDHMSGVKEILEAMPEETSLYEGNIWEYTGTPVIKRVVLPELYGTGKDEAYVELVELAKEKKVQVYFMAAGDRMQVGQKLVLSCLAPEEGVAYTDKNAASMVLLATYGEFDLLLTGDMEKEGEARILESGVLGNKEAFREEGGRLENEEEENTETVSVEVLKVAHHGSYTASSEEFITALAPEISVISCGKNNRYGHPHAETLTTLFRASSRVYRTDERGCVTVKVGKRGGYEVECRMKSD